MVQFLPAIDIFFEICKCVGGSDFCPDSFVAVAIEIDLGGTGFVGQLAKCLQKHIKF